MARTGDRELLEAALAGYQHTRQTLVERIAEIRRQLGADDGKHAKPRKKRTVHFTPEGKRRIAEGVRKRWEAYRKAKRQ